MPKIIFVFLFLSLPNLARAAWIGSSIDRHAALCATLLIPGHGVQASVDRQDILNQLKAYLTATALASNDAPPIPGPDLERLQELANTLADTFSLRLLPDPGRRAWTFTGRAEIEHYAASLAATRTSIEGDIEKFETKLGNFKTQSGAALTDALVVFSPLFYLRAFLLETSGIVDWAAHDYSHFGPLLAANAMILGFASIGALDAPWRFLATRQKGFAQIQSTIKSFLNGTSATAHWGTRLKISDELISSLYRGDKVSGKALSDQNLRERIPGLAHLIWDWQRSRRGQVDGQFEADALLWRSPLGEPNLTLIVQRTSPPK